MSKDPGDNFILEGATIGRPLKEKRGFDWQKLGEIAATIDGGCNVCIKSFTWKVAQFPGFDRNAYVIGLKSEDPYFAEDIDDDWFKER
jgi:hypothetical protein